MRLFISYARKDLAKVKQAVRYLERGRHTPWFDEKLVAGDDFKVALQREIEQSDAFVYMLSPASLASEWCQWEYSTAVAAGKRIIPVLIQQTPLPPSLAGRHYIDFTRQTAYAVAQLLGDLLLVAELIPPEAVPAPSDPRGLPERTLRQGRLTLLLVIALIVMALFILSGIVLLLLPISEREHVLYNLSAGVLVSASSTPTPTSSPTLTPTPPPTHTPTPTLANYDIGIAIAYFKLPDDNSVDEVAADTLVTQIEARLVSELEDFAQTVDLSIGFIPPATIGRIEGETPLEREENARDIARRYAANIVLYGEITLSPGGLLEVQPAFYVAPEAFADALEMTGTFRLGRKIEVEGSLTNVRNALEVNRPLSARASAVAQIFAGLIHYLLEDYEQAIVAFEAAAAEPDWGDTEGREVLHLLLGNAYTRLAAVAAQNGDTTTATDQMQLAEAEYQRAVELAPDYSRPYAGLASLTYLQWTVSAQTQTAPDMELLETAGSYLEQADAALDESQDVGIQSRRLFTRLQIDYVTWVNSLQSDEADALYDQFTTAARQIIRRYDSGRSPSVQELASESYAFLGLAAYNQNDCEPAIDSFEQAIELSLSVRRSVFFYGWIGDCYAALGRAEAALQAYDTALELGEAADVSQVQLNDLQTRRDNVGGRG